MRQQPAPEPLEMAVRGYSVPKPKEEKPDKGRNVEHAGRQPQPRVTRPSDWTLTWDTEFAVDAAQQLRIGAYQVRKARELRESGLFYDPLSLSDADVQTLKTFAQERGLVVRTVREFVEDVFFRVLIDWNGTCVGFGLPGDLAKLATGHETARSADMRGGFSFKLSDQRRRPYLQVRHNNSAQSFIRFTYPPVQKTPRGMRKRKLKVRHTRGWFVDVRTAAASLLEHRGDLKSLGKLLGTQAQKSEADYEAAEITPEFIEYTLNDVQLTWECYEALAGRYVKLGLDEPLPKIYSAASIAKATVAAMGIKPWTSCHPDFPPELIGRLMAGYYGGRSEVKLRRVVKRVLYADFLSTYPTVCSLIGISRFVAATGIETYDATDEVQQLLTNLTAHKLQQPETWRKLPVLVELEPEADLLPVRGKYDGTSYTIGLNYLSSYGKGMWYALPDVVVAVLLGEKLRRVRQAIGFRPGPLQDELRPVDLMGNPAYRVDPRTDDIFRRLIELRTELKAKRDEAKKRGDNTLAEQYDADQLALKIVANAMYGFFIELNVTDSDDLEGVTCYGRDEPFDQRLHQLESPGRFFHPLLGVLIASAARLMLGLAERRIVDAELEWAFCDTDSMAIAMPDGMSEQEFLTRAQEVLDWFEPLKPYAIEDRLFKLEDANYALGSNGKPTSELHPLYVFAVSDKRYSLLNIDAAGLPVLRKASAHGLGHLRPPYGKESASSSIPAPVVAEKDLGVSRWQHDIWYRILLAALEGHPDTVDLSDIPALDLPAVSRYAATTPRLLRWFEKFNQGKEYREQVRPFGFLLAFQAKRRYEERLELAGKKRRRSGDATVPAVVAPYASDPGVAAQRAFDRHSKDAVPAEQLKTYREVLAQYHLHPEAKFHNGDYTDRGPTERRHVRPLGPIDHIGKEANRWEEQFYLRRDPETQIEYGSPGSELAAYYEEVRAKMQGLGVREISRAAKVSLGTVSGVKSGTARPSLRVLRAIDRATDGTTERRLK